MESLCNLETEADGFNYKRGGGAGLVAFVLLGMNTALIPNPLFVRQIPVVFWDYLFLGSTSILAGFYFGLSENCRPQNNNRYALFGGLTGLFSFACPICNGLLLALFSTATIMNYIEPLRPFLGLVSTGILVAFFVASQRCEVNQGEAEGCQR